MKTYQSSDKLKKQILRVAWQIFQVHGYEKTTYKMIADELNIVPGTIVYHFKSKPLILYHIFIDYGDLILDYIQENLTEGFNHYLRVCILHICFYREVLQRESHRTLVYNKSFLPVWESKISGLDGEYIRDITDDFHKGFTDEEIHMASVLNYAAKKGLLKEFMQNTGAMTVDRCCYYFAYMIGVLSRLDEATIQKNIKLAFEFADSHTIPSL